MYVFSQVFCQLRQWASFMLSALLNLELQLCSYSFQNNFLPIPPEEEQLSNLEMFSALFEGFTAFKLFLILNK